MLQYKNRRSQDGNPASGLVKILLTLLYVIFGYVSIKKESWCRVMNDPLGFYGLRGRAGEWDAPVAHRPWLDRAPEPERYERTESPEEIEKCISCTAPDCTNCISRAKNGSNFSYQRDVSAITDAEFSAAYDAGTSDVAIAKILRVSQSTAYKMRTARGLAAKSSGWARRAGTV